MKKSLKLITIIAILCSILLLLNNFVYAESKSYANISASSKEINVGDTVTVNVEVFAGSWSININGGGLEAVGDTTGLAGQTSVQGNSRTSKTYTFKANSAGTYTISINGDITDYDTDENMDINKSVTITAKAPQQPDPTVTFTDTNKTMYVNATSLNLRKEYNTSSTILKSLKKDESVTVLAIGSNGWYKVKASNGTEGYVDSTYLTDKKPEETDKSSITTLSEIKVNPGNLNETFSKDRQTYSMTVNADVDSIEVTATPTDNKARVTVTGNKGLKTGTDNTITIRVLAEDETSSRIYKIQVTKLATEDEDPNLIDEEGAGEKKLGLTSLSIEKLRLTPTFKQDVYEYTATLTDRTIEKLNVNAIASFEDAKVEITGADEIKNGENVITITVTSADGENTVTYQIIVKKEEIVAVAKTDKNEEKDNTKLFLIIGIVVAIVALVVITIVMSKKSKGKPVKIYEDGDYNETEEYHNSSSDEEYQENSENIEDEEYYDEEDDDDWGTPKRGLFGKIKKTGRH